MPWRRLTKEWLIYAGLMAVVFAVLFRGDGIAPILVGLLVSGPLYLLFGSVMAKFGYTRKTLADLRTPRATTTSAAAPGSEDRARPAPTRRTSPGSNRPNRSRRR